MSDSNGAEAAFSATPPGEIEVKKLPGGYLLESQVESPYFESSGRLFRPLFDYIDERGISMTTPVEARMNPGKMYFWVGSDEVDKLSGNTDNVSIVSVPPRQVAAAGGRGSYSEENYREKEGELYQWLASSKEWEPSGEPFAVYWNGPFTLWFLKKFEVMIEVVPASR